MIINLNYIKALRAYNRLNQTQVAESLGCTYQTYNNKENGKTNFTVPELDTLSKLFNVPTANFFAENVSIKETKQDD